MDPAVVEIVSKAGPGIALVLSVYGNVHLWRAYRACTDARIQEVERIATALERSAEALERSTEALARRRG